MRERSGNFENGFVRQGEGHTKEKILNTGKLWMKQTLKDIATNSVILLLSLRKRMGNIEGEKQATDEANEDKGST